MKKLFVFAVAALLSVFAFAGEPRAVLTEMSSQGNVQMTRTLTDKNVLTESVCKVQAQGTASRSTCVSQSIVLSARAALEVAKDMRSNQLSLLSSAPTDDTSAQSNSSISSGHSASMHSVKSASGLFEKGISRTSSHSQSLNEQKAVSDFVFGRKSD